MPVRPGDDDAEYLTVGGQATTQERYAEVRLENGALIVYDRDDEQGWIQSDAAVDLESMA